MRSSSIGIGGRVAAATAFAVFLLAMHFIRGLPWIVPVAYALLSAACFAAYGIDKRNSLRNRRRIPETRLHALELLGGWPGGLVAQGFFRHKTRKVSFLVPFWAIVAIHLLGWAYYCFH